MLVVPSSKKNEFSSASNGTKVVSWRELAAQLKSEPLKMLLRQADEAHSGFKDALTEAEVQSEMAALASGGPDARWPGIYSFLSTLDVQLGEVKGYRATGGWSMRRRADGYADYGYMFTWDSASTETQRAWVGFLCERGKPVSFGLYKNDKLVESPIPLNVDEAVARVRGRIEGT